MCIKKSKHLFKTLVFSILISLQIKGNFLNKPMNI